MEGAVCARAARTTDGADIAMIWNEGIEDRVATFETGPRTADQIATWMREKEPTYPTVVVERDGRVIAWAAASRALGGLDALVPVDA